METVIGLQEREPRSSSVYSSTTTFNSYCSTEKVVVRELGEEIRVFFETKEHPTQGVGLQMPKQVATALAHLVLAVAQGRSGNVSASV